jgi:integrase
VQDKQKNKPSSESSIKTYNDLEDAYLAHLRSENKSEQELKNFRSNLNSWRQFFNAETDTEIHLHFGKKFSVNLEKFKANQLKNKAKESTVASKASNLKKINEFLSAKSTLENLSPKFGERLRQLIRNSGYKSTHEFWRLHLQGKCATSSFRNWCSGAWYPTEAKTGLIKEIENLLEVPAETLTSLLRSTFNQTKVVRKETVNSRRLRLVSSFNYRVWEKPLEEEFQGLVEFKTGTVLPEGMERYKDIQWTESEGGGLGSATFTKTELQSFFGFLCLPKDAADIQLRGKSYPKDELTLGLIADKTFVESYVTEFKKSRSFNKYNNGHIHFLTMCTSLLRPGTGYLYQSPAFAEKIGLSGDVEEWQNKCLDTRNRLLKVLNPIQRQKKTKGKDFQMGRDPKEPIEDILALTNPLDAIMDLLSVMLSDLDTYVHGKKKAIFFRDILLIAFLVANPLRINMFAIMQFNRNLVRKDDGSWWIRFNREDFKNRSSLKSDYEVLVAPEIVPLIETYQRDYRPFLSGAAESDYVFLKEYQIEKKLSKKQEKEELTSLIYKKKTERIKSHGFVTRRLSDRISVRVRRYIPLSPGFRAHAFRHIVATNIIKNNPEMGYFLASKALHDKLETIEDNYEHLKTHEFFAPYNRFISGFFSQIIDTDGNSISIDGNDGGRK